MSGKSFDPAGPLNSGSGQTELNRPTSSFDPAGPLNTNPGGLKVKAHCPI